MHRVAAQRSQALPALCRHWAFNPPSRHPSSLPARAKTPGRPKRRKLLWTAAISVASATAAHPMAAAAPHVAVITTLGCPHCRRAKAALRKAGLQYEEIELSGDRELLAKIKEITGQTTVPQVFVGGQLVGGASETVAELDSGALQKRVAEASRPPLPDNLKAAFEEEAARAATAGSAAKPSGLWPLGRELRAGAGAGADATFSLRAALDWLTSARSLAREDALAQLAALQRANVLQLLPDAPGAGPAEQQPLAEAAAAPGGNARLLRLAEDAPAPAALADPLNRAFPWFGAARPAREVSEELRKRALGLFDAHLSDDGRTISYKSMRADPAWRAFVVATAELQKVDPYPLGREERIAFFINIYNALVVHALAVHGPAKDSLARLRWFDSVSYLIGGDRYSTNAIEHGVLRGNKPSPASLLGLVGLGILAPKTFGASDPRRKLAVSPLDPRIHFALNCGALSCPPIKVYSADNLETALAGAAASFVAAEAQVLPETKALELSMIFKWYGKDFGGKEDLVAFLLKYLPQGEAAKLQALVDEVGAKEVKLTYKPYDWGANAAEE